MWCNFLSAICLKVGNLFDNARIVFQRESTLQAKTLDLCVVLWLRRKVFSKPPLHSSRRWESRMEKHRRSDSWRRTEDREKISEGFLFPYGFQCAQIDIHVYMLLMSERGTVGYRKLVEQSSFPSVTIPNLFLKCYAPFIRKEHGHSILSNNFYVWL